MPETNGKATIREVHEIVERMEGKLNVVLLDHETRIRALQAGRMKLMGIFVSLAVLIPIIVTLILFSIQSAS